MRDVRPLLLLFLPFCISTPAALLRSMILFIASIVSVFLILHFERAFRTHENTTAFIMTALWGIAPNIILSIIAVNLMHIENGIMHICMGILAFVTLFSAEQTIIGYIVRSFWNKQDGFLDKSDNLDE